MTTKELIENVDLFECWTGFSLDFFSVVRGLSDMKIKTKALFAAFLLVVSNILLGSAAFADHRAAHKNVRPTASSGGSVKAMVEN